MNKEKNLLDDAMISEAFNVFIKAIMLALVAILILFGVLELFFPKVIPKETVIRTEWREYEILEYGSYEVNLLDVKTHQLFRENFRTKTRCNMVALQPRDTVKVLTEYYTIQTEPNKTFIRLKDVKEIFCK